MAQSGIDARFAFRLDKFIGRVWQYFKGANDGGGWEVVIVLAKPTASAKLNFPIRNGCNSASSSITKWKYMSACTY